MTIMQRVDKVLFRRVEVSFSAGDGVGVAAAVLLATLRLATSSAAGRVTVPSLGQPTRRRWR